MYLSKYFFDIAAVCVCMTCLLFLLIQRRIPRTRNKIYVNILLNLAASGVFTTLGGYFENSFRETGYGSYPAMYLCLFLYFILHASLAFLFCCYVFMVNGLAERRSMIFYVTLTIPMILTELLVLSSPFTSAIFYIDPNNFFRRGPLEWVMYLMSVCYMIAAVYSLLRYQKAVTTGVRHTILLFFVVTLIAVLVQFLIPGLKVELFAEALSMLAVLLIIENEDQRVDPITGVYNREAFTVENNRLLGTGHAYTVFGINLNNSDSYLSVLSPADYESLLREISSFLSAQKEADLVFYPLKNIFAVICMELEGHAEESQAAVNRLEAILKERFAQDWSAGKLRVHLHPAIIEGKIPEEFSSAQGILKMIRAGEENNGFGSFVILKGKDLAYLSRREQVEEAIKKAVATENFEVVYQPIWDAAEDKIVTAEALVRLRDPALGYISPEEFIPVAEKSGLIVELGRIVFEKVCRFQQTNHLDELGLKYVEVNLSTFQLASERLEEQFLEILDKYDVPVEFINLEITESASASDNAMLLRTIRKMQKAGFRFSLDDFGTGYSNLSNLLKIDYNNIKIDKSILWSAENGDDAKTILEDNIHTIRKLGLNVVQEGVETRAQLDEIVSLGGNLIQGFFFSKPLPEEEFITYVKEFKGKDKV
ncbi:MAG: EAL domain-containing protein [Lachnospiraceae bacterium]|nr:EAL domain-containing protein [Lachnospiraceae bacterium]